MTRIIAFLAALVLAAPAWADDTFSCMDELSGPLVNVVVPNEEITDGVRFDARGVEFTVLSEPGGANYLIDLRGTGAYCWAGGIARFTNDEAATREERYYQDGIKIGGAGIMSNSGPSIIDGIRIHNAFDALKPKDSPFTIRNAWVSYARDDCVENDGMRPGLIEDSLFDGCYVFLSSRNKADFPNESVVTIRDSLIRLQEMPGPRGFGGDVIGSGPLFKYQEQSPNLILENNVFLIEDYPSLAWNSDGTAEYSFEMLGFHTGAGLIDKLKSCSGNIIVWLGLGEFPGDVPDDPACVTVTKDRTIWDNARAKWLAEHPLVMRIAGVDDSAPTPEPTPDPDPIIVDPDEPFDPIPDPEPTPEPEPTKKGKGWWCKRLGICWK